MPVTLSPFADEIIPGELVFGVARIFGTCSPFLLLLGFTEMRFMDDILESPHSLINEYLEVDIERTRS